MFDARDISFIFNNDHQYNNSPKVHFHEKRTQSRASLLIREHRGSMRLFKFHDDDIKN